MADRSLTTEDKLTLLTMTIMKKMDKDIERQEQYINVETIKLKGFIDQRSQMFDMLRQIIDKYNLTAKGIIDTIGR